MSRRFRYGRALLVGLWLGLVATGLYLFFVERGILERELGARSSTSFLAGSAVYLLFGCLRGFTLIPVTALLVSAIPFFPPLRLFVLTVIGILMSSASVYWFSDALRLDELFARKHGHHVRALHDWLQRYELPVIIGWSFFPFVPTDLICYMCGTLHVDLRKCLLGVGLGEGTICAVYVFLGDYVLRTLGIELY